MVNLRKLGKILVIMSVQLFGLDLLLAYPAPARTEADCLRRKRWEEPDMYSDREGKRICTSSGSFMREKMSLNICEFLGFECQSLNVAFLFAAERQAN